MLDNVEKFEKGIIFLVEDRSTGNVYEYINYRYAKSRFLELDNGTLSMVDYTQDVLHKKLIIEVGELI